MWYWLSKGTGGRASVLAQRARRESPSLDARSGGLSTGPLLLMLAVEKRNLGRSFVSTSLP